MYKSVDQVDLVTLDKHEINDMMFCLEREFLDRGPITSLK